MKKMLGVFWQDLIRIITRIYLPLCTTVIFAMIAANFWPDYFHVTTFIYLVISFCVSDYLFKKKPK